MRFPAPICIACAHYHVGDPEMTCDAYPKGIPEEILFRREFHQENLPGDNGIKFLASPGDEELAKKLMGK